MWTDLLTLTIVISVLSSTVRIATPLLLAALGELVTEKTGVLNLGVEGTMLMGAWVGFFVTERTGSLIFGIGGALITGLLFSLIMAFMGVTLGLDQVVIGLGINLLASGLSFYWYRVSYQIKGVINTPTIDTFPLVKIPLLSEIPIIGRILFSQQSLTYFAFLLVPIIWIFLYRTKYGLVIRGVGEYPKAVDMKGINVWKYQYAGVLFGGMMSGLGGAFLTLGSTGLFVADITSGRGWLALVIVIAGNWMPWRVMIAALVFAFLSALQLQIQGVGINLPYQIPLVIPYIVAILTMMGSRQKARAPAALGEPYIRE